MYSSFTLTTITCYFYKSVTQQCNFGLLFRDRFFFPNDYSCRVTQFQKILGMCVWDIHHATVQTKTIPFGTWIKYHLKDIRIHITTYYKETTCCTDSKTGKGTCFDLCFPRLSILWGYHLHHSKGHLSICYCLSHFMPFLDYEDSGPQVRKNLTWTVCWLCQLYLIKSTDFLLRIGEQSKLILDETVLKQLKLHNKLIQHSLVKEVNRRKGLTSLSKFKTTYISSDARKINA